MTVAVSVQHDTIGNVNLYLQAPTGIISTLSINNGGFGDGYGASPYARTIFDDESPTPITSGTAPFVGVFQPEAPLSVFNGLSGVAVNGNWYLYVQDLGNDNITGYIRGWSIVIKD